MSDKILILEKKWRAILKVRPVTDEVREEKERIGSLYTNAAYQESQPLLLDLKNIGIVIEDIWDLVNTKDTYPKAIPILIEHLQKPYYYKTKEAIARSLRVLEAKGKGSQEILDEYRRTPESDSTCEYRWALTYCFAFITSSKKFELDATQIVLDKTNGKSRSQLLAYLKKIKSNNLRDTLQSVIQNGNLNEDDFSKEIAEDYLKLM